MIVVSFRCRGCWSTTVHPDHRGPIRLSHLPFDVPRAEVDQVNLRIQTKATLRTGVVKRQWNGVAHRAAGVE